MERSKRDYRVDFCRGMALLVIFWDHAVAMTQGYPIYFRLTPQHWGFSDAAELFVFLSGYVFGIVYGRVLDSDGFRACQRKAFHRVWQIYAANSIALLSTMGVVSIFVYGLHTSPGYLNEFLDAPFETAARGAVLNYLPWNFGILPLYMVILAVMPPMLVLLRKNVWAGLALSFALYVCTQVFPGLNLPRYNDPDGWNFNPFAWQFLFTIAAAFGIGALKSERIPRNRTLLALALAVLAVGPILRIGGILTEDNILNTGKWAWLFPIRFPYGVGLANLSPLRLVYFFATVYVGLRLLPRESRIWSHPLVQPIIRCGQHSLSVFSTSVVLSYALDLAYEASGGGYPLLLLMLGVGMIILLLTGNFLAARKRRLRQAARPPQTLTTETETA